MYTVIYYNTKDLGLSHGGQRRYLIGWSWHQQRPAHVRPSCSRPRSLSGRLCSLMPVFNVFNLHLAHCAHPLRSSCLDSSTCPTILDPGTVVMGPDQWHRSPIALASASLCRWSGNVLDARTLADANDAHMSAFRRVASTFNVHHLHLPRCKSSSTINPAFADCLHAKAFTMSNH